MNGDVVRVLPRRSVADPESDAHLRQEWLVANGLGGYASGTVGGAMTRRYHGWLISALPNPLGRMMMLNAIAERLRFPDYTAAYIGPMELSGVEQSAMAAVSEFRLEAGLPVWRYEVNGFVLEKRLLMPHQQNTVHIGYRLLEGAGKLRLGLRPAVNFRSHDAHVGTRTVTRYELKVVGDEYELWGSHEIPPLRMTMHGPHPGFTFERKDVPDINYRMEQNRGYEFTGALWSPGYFRVDLEAGQDATLVASTESWETLHALQPFEALLSEIQRRRMLIGTAHPNARSAPASELVLAADQFIITPAGRVEDAARARAMGDEVRTVIAGYYWFTDWGRDTMISFEGLTLATRRYHEAGWILRTFAHYVKDGLIPNMFPEGEKDGLYHTADATLWFFHAMNRYVEATDDRATLRLVLPKLLDIYRHHIRGTHFNICVDPDDGLLHQGAEGYQLTWMDAKVEDWVVTPRRGKAVEINALWYNAQRLLAKWLREERGPGDAQPVEESAGLTYKSFQERFWYEAGGYLYDVIEAESGGNDCALRPNQLLAISLDYPVLDQKYWSRVLEVVRAQLLTPVGLRSLAPGHPDYKAKYYGDLRARDAAYHQGTVWGWLIGPFVDAWLKVYPNDRAGARRCLEGLTEHLEQACVGSISEIFDAEEPYTPRGCIAQAWSVAEALRCWVKTA
jgi:predicted glycogen debranching enzyme